MTIYECVCISFQKWQLNGKLLTKIHKILNEKPKYRYYILMISFLNNAQRHLYL